jgi:hypothetical protein
LVPAGYIKKCSLKDPEFKACALKSARDAIPHIVKGEYSLDSISWKSHEISFS